MKNSATHSVGSAYRDVVRIPVILLAGRLKSMVMYLQSEGFAECKTLGISGQSMTNPVPAEGFFNDNANSTDGNSMFLRMSYQRCACKAVGR